MVAKCIRTCIYQSTRLAPQCRSFHLSVCVSLVKIILLYMYTSRPLLFMVWLPGTQKFSNLIQIPELNLIFNTLGTNDLTFGETYRQILNWLDIMVSSNRVSLITGMWNGMEWVKLDRAVWLSNVGMLSKQCVVMQ